MEALAVWRYVDLPLIRLPRALVDEELHASLTLGVGRGTARKEAIAPAQRAEEEDGRTDKEDISVQVEESRPNETTDAPRTALRVRDSRRTANGT